MMGTTKEESVDVESRGLKGSRNQCFSVRDGGWQTANGVWSGNLRKKGCGQVGGLVCTIADEEMAALSVGILTGYGLRALAHRWPAPAPAPFEPTTQIKGES